MKKLNIQILKDIFYKKEQTPNYEQELEQDVDNPYLNYSIAIRGVSQLDLLDQVYMNRNPQEYSIVRDKVKSEQYDFIYSFLIKVPLENDKDIIEFVLKDLGKSEVLTNLNKIINHFVEIEEYEKCAKAQKYLQKVEKKLNLAVDL